MTGSELYRKLGDWFHNNTSPLIPQAGLDYPQALIEEFQVYFDPQATIRLEGFNLHGMPDKYLGFNPPCQLVNLPLIVALHSGLSEAKLIAIANHHPIDVSRLINTLDSVMGTGYKMEDIFEGVIPLTKIYSQCITVIAKVYPEEFSKQLGFLKERSGINALSLLSENPDHWPTTRLQALMKGYEQGNLLPGQYFNDEFFNINYTFISNDYLPKDAEGLPDYEAFLERSGMLLPEVIRKKLGQVGLWEQMLTVALYNAQSQGNDPQGMAGLLDYCIHKAPEHLQPAIFRALSNLALVNAEGVVDGKGIYNFLRDKAGDTWLEPLFENPLLLINLVAEDGPVQYGNFAVLDRPESLLDRCFKEIMATPSDQLGFTHFGIFLLNAMDPPEQVLSPDLKPESVIRHMLQGLDGYSLPASTQEFRSEHMNDAALQGCKYVIKTLMARYELDYRALKGISSLGVRVLVEAGLDKRQLPRMNNHDKSRLLSEELGL